MKNDKTIQDKPGEFKFAVAKLHNKDHLSFKINALKEGKTIGQKLKELVLRYNNYEQGNPNERKRNFQS